MPSLRRFPDPVRIRAAISGNYHSTARRRPAAPRRRRRRGGARAADGRQHEREMARRGRFELPTPRFVVWCSIQLSYRRLGFAAGCCREAAGRRPGRRTRAKARSSNAWLRPVQASRGACPRCLWRDSALARVDLVLRRSSRRGVRLLRFCGRHRSGGANRDARAAAFPRSLHSNGAASPPGFICAGAANVASAVHGIRVPYGHAVRRPGSVRRI